MNNVFVLILETTHTVALLQFRLVSSDSTVKAEKTKASLTHGAVSYSVPEIKHVSNTV